MVEVSLIVIGVVFFAWLVAVVWQAQRGAVPEHAGESRAFVPLLLPPSEEALLVAEGRGHIVFVNEPARRWFGLDGGTPHLAAIARQIRPVDSFYELLAQPGHAALRVGNRQVEAISQAIPGPQGQRMIVLMRELDATAHPLAFEFDPLRALTVAEDISRAASSSLDLPSLVRAIFTSLEPVIPFDTAEITLAEPDGSVLRTVGGVQRTPYGDLTPLDLPADVYAPGEGYTGWMALYRQPLLIDEIDTRADVTPKAIAAGVRSYLGVPLLAGERCVGTLELGHRQPRAFDRHDLALLQALAGQISAALQMARFAGEQAERLRTLGGVQQIAEAAGRLDDVHTLMGQITGRVAGLLRADVCGVLLYDEAEGLLQAQPPFYGVPDVLVAGHRISPSAHPDLATVWQAQTPWLTDAPDDALVRALGLGELMTAIAVHSLALAPLLAGGRRVGLLLVANEQQKGYFDEADLRRLSVFAGQAAVIIDNMRLHEQARQRARALGGLQQVAGAMGAVRSPTELYGQITARIAALFEAELCGILLYDPAEQVLVSQRPFYGMDDEERVRFYQIPSPPGSPVAQLWQTRDAWICNDLRHDPAALETALGALAVEVGIYQTMLAPLIVGGRRLGIIQVANRRDGRDFSQDDAQLLCIFAGQAAMLIDNARLMSEMQRRTHHAEGLRAVAEIATRGAPSLETLEEALVAVANILRSEAVLAALVDENSGALVLDPRHVWGISLDEPYRIDAYAAGFEQSVLVSRRTLLSNDLITDERILPPYRPLIERHQLRAWIQVPLLVQDRAIGELTVANRSDGMPYDEEDADLLAAIATQIAALIDRLRLLSSGSHDLHARIQELSALGRITHELSRTLELDRVLEVIRQEALRSTAATGVSLVLLAERDEWEAEDAPLVEQRFGEEQLLDELTPAEQAAILGGSRLIVGDYQHSDYEPHPADARSSLIVPITFGELVIGALHLYSTQPDAFDQRAVEFAQALTDQATVAITNARRYREQIEANRALRVRAERMGRIFHLSEMFRQGASLQELLEEVAHSIQETVGFNVVLISVVDEEAGVLRRTAQAGLPLSVFEELRQTAPPLEQAYSLMQDSFRISNSYFLPAEGSEELTTGLPTYAVLQERMGSGPRAWHPDDLLLVPLTGSGGRLLGLISVDEPQSGRRPTFATVEALEIFASQAAFSIENYRLVERIQQEAEATRRERDRLAQLHRVATRIQAAKDIPSRLQVVADGIREAGWEHVVITLRDERLEPTALIQAGYTSDENALLQEEIIPGAVWRRWLNDLAFHELRLGAGYYLRYDHPWVREHVLKGQVLDPPSVPEGVWHPRDVVYLPLIGQDQQRIIGIITMRDPLDRRAPTEASLQPFELFAAHAAAAIETGRLYQETLRAAEQEQRLNEVMEAVSASIRPEQIVAAIARGLQRLVPFTRMSVALYDEVAGHFNVYQAEVTGITAPEVVRDVPLDVSGTVTWEVYREASARFFRLEHQADAREQFSDLRAWYNAGERSTLLVPMISGVQAIGVLRLGTELENAFGFEENRDLIQRLANLSAVSLENVQLFARAQERAAALDAQAQRMALLNRVALALAQTLDLENIFEIALREAAISLGITEGAAMQIDPERNLAHMVVEYPRGDAPPELALDVTSNAALRLIQDELVPIVVERVPGDPLYEALRAWLRREDVFRSLLVPLVAGGQVIGVLCLNALSPERFFSDEQIELAQTIGSQAAIAVQNAALFEQTAQRTRELETLFESAQATAVTLDLNEVARRVTVQMVAALSADACTVFLWDDVNDTLIVRGEVSARSGSTASEQVGDVYSLAPYPLRSKALREHTLLVVRADDPDLPPGERDLMLRHAAASRILVPLVVNDVAIGLVEVELLDPERRIVPGMLRLAQALGSQAAISIENARLQTETRRTVEELYVINDISSGLSAANTLEDLLQVIDTLLPSLTDADALYVALYDPLNQQITFPLATNVLDDEPLNEPPRPLGRDEFSVVIEQRAPVLLAGQDLFDLRDRLQIDTIMPEARCFLGVPLFAADEVIGVLAVRNDRNPLAFSSSDQRILTTVGAQLGIAIQSMRLFQQTLQLAEELEQRVRERTAELEQERQHIATLYGISTELASSLDMDRLLSRALELVAHAVSATHGAILQLDREAERLVFRAYYGWPEGTLTGNGAEPSALTLDEGLAGWAVRNRRSLVIDDVQQDQRWLRLGEADDIPRSAMAVLIETSEDILGVAMLYSDRVGAFTEDHLRLVTAAAHQVANAMNNAELYGLIRDQAERLGTLLRQEQIEATKSAAILDSVADGVLVANEYGEIIVFNQTASRILGLPVESVLGRTMADVAGLYGPSRPRLVSAVQRWMRDPASYEPGEFIEERLELDNKRVVSVRISPVYLDEQFLGTVSVFRDITREVEVDRLKSEFVATVSHELRTPMTSIKGYADLLLLGAAGEIQPQQRSFLETIKNNADRLSILVNDLLDISRIDQGRVELRFGPVDVAAVIEQIAAHLRGRSEDERRAMQVIVRPPNDPTLTVWGDYDKVAQILTNLADNAFNYTPEGGTITLSAERDPAGGDVIFAVSDTGIGIPPEIAPRVFERFFRGDEIHEMVMDTPGTGLGLAIVRELVQFHRGEVWFDSEVGKGTTFYVRLPVRAPEMQTIDTAAHAEGE
ncbi:MAG: hypothetical protein Kow00106_08350 [Anaerolineae bacterium]